MQLTDETVDFAVALFSSLANGTRLRIVDLLTSGELTVNEVAQSLGISQPNASQHLAILQRNGVVKVTPKGTQRCYAIRGPRVARLIVLVNEFRDIHAESIRQEQRVYDGHADSSALIHSADPIVVQPLRRTRHRKVMPLTAASAS